MPWPQYAEKKIELSLLLLLLLLFRFRKICYKIATNKYFVNFVLILIIVSSILLAAEDPLNASATRNKVS